jgi:rubrerythrin
MENDAIEIGLKLLSVAPPETIAQLVEITADENDHSRIYTEMIERYAGEG